MTLIVIGITPYIVPSTSTSSDAIGQEALATPMPVGELLGIRVYSARRGEVDCRLTILDEHLNQGLVAHGGVLFTLADTALGLAANPAGQGTTWVGTGFNLQLYRAAKVGETIRAVAAIEHQTRNLIICRAEIDRTSDARRIGALSAQLLRLPDSDAEPKGRVEVRPARPESPLVCAMRAAYRREAEFTGRTGSSGATGASGAVALLAVLYVDQQPRGYARLCGVPPGGELDELWIHPGWRGPKLQRALRHGIERVAHELASHAPETQPEEPDERCHNPEHRA